MEIDDNGVVNPLRAPRFVRQGLESARALPPVAVRFVALAAAVAIADLVQRRSVDLFLVSRAATVLFPAALLWRRPDAAIATPRLERGTLLLAAGVILGEAMRLVWNVLPNDVVLGDDPAIRGTQLLASLAVSILAIAGWALVARSLAELRPRIPGALRVLAAAVVIGSALANGGLDLFMLSIGGSSLDAATTAAVVAAGLANWLVVAALGWVLITRVGGLPRLATVLAAAGIALLAIGTLPAWALQLFSYWQADELLAAWQEPLNGLFRLTLLSPVLFALSLALGLGDPPSESEPA